MKDPSFVITPGLSNVVTEFESHIKVARGRPILVIGPSGSGKSLLIEIFKHYHQKARPEAPFVVVNCAAFPETLIESELFGHKKGAFTGAVNDRPGWLKKSDSGVIVLEEIGELAKHIQAKLLVFLQNGEYSPVGSTEVIKSNVQILGTTNREHEPGKESVIRDDFWYRFSHFYIHALHRRRSDILYLLIEKYPEIARTLTHQDVLFFLAYNWPGNVRELESVALKLERLRDMLGDESFKEPHLTTRLYSMEWRIHNPFREMERNYWRLQKLLLPYLKERDDQPFPAFGHLGGQVMPFKKLPTVKREKTKLGIPKLLQEDRIRAIYRNFKLYCAIFHLDSSEDVNLLDLETSSIKSSFLLLRNEFNVDDTLFRLSKQIYSDRRFPRGRENPKDDPMAGQRVESLPAESDDLHLEKVKEMLVGMSQDQLIKFYHDALLEKAGGNSTKAAKMAGVSSRMMQRYAATRKHSPGSMP
jgi:hypothetical protein